MKKLVSIGLLSYERTNLLIETLKDIMKVSMPIDIIIVNNNTYDIENDIEFVKDNAQIKLKYIWDKKNYGVSDGRTKIVENLDTEYLIILDDDVHIPDINTIINNTITSFVKEKEIGALAFHIIDYKTGHANRYEIPHKDKDLDLSQDFYTYLLIGAGHAVRKSVFEHVGAYPDDFGLYGMEEIDLAFRIIGNGYRIKFISSNIIHHKRSPDGRHINLNVLYLSYVNRCKIAKKYLKTKYLLTVIFIRGGYFLLKTRNIKLLLSAIREIINYHPKTKKFDDSFYQEISNVRGFIYW